MRKEDCFYLGKIVKKYSFKGELLIKLDTDEPELYGNLDAMFVSLRNSFLPFFIEQSSWHKEGLLRVRFEDVEDEDDAERMIGAEIFLPLNLLPKLSGNKFYYHEIIGFNVHDHKHGDIGKVSGVNDQTSQALLVIQNKEAEILMPINDDIIKVIDRENSILHIQSPEGLIEIYLEN